MPLTTSMMELGQEPHTPPSRMRATPWATSRTSSCVPSIARAGPTCSASARATRAFRSSGVMLLRRLRLVGLGRALLEALVDGVEELLHRERLAQVLDHPKVLGVGLVPAPL